jgi:hypothetical protein
MLLAKKLQKNCIEFRGFKKKYYNILGFGTNLKYFFATDVEIID